MNEYKTKTKNCTLKIKEIDIENGVFSGYASVFGVVDSYGEVVEKGAFLDSLALKMPKLLWQHTWKQPIGYYLEAYEDNYGLFVKGQLLIDDITTAKEAFALLKTNSIDGLSIGYNIIEEELAENGIKILRKLDLLEVSIVTFPANQEATILSVKSENEAEKAKSSLDRLAQLVSDFNVNFLKG